MSHSLGRDPATDSILFDPRPQYRLVVPDVCVLEALITFEGVRKRHRTILVDLERQIGEARRNKASQRVGPLVAHLEQSVIDLDVIFNESRARMVAAVERVVGLAELIPLTPTALADGLSRPLLNDPADNLILASILDHAGSNAAVEKVFVSENRRDFDHQPFPKSAIQAAGIKYVEQASQFLQWWRSRAES